MTTIPAIETAEDALNSAQVNDNNVELTLLADKQGVLQIELEISETGGSAQETTRLNAAKAKVTADEAAKVLSDAAVATAQQNLATAVTNANGVAPLAEAMAATLNLKQDYNNDWSETTRKDWKKDWV